MVSGAHSLLLHQYRDSSNLSARAQLHTRFSTNKHGWHRWVFEQFTIPRTARVLELGSGPAWLWVDNWERVPTGWDITLTDSSSGMIAEARVNLTDMPHPFSFDVVDAQIIPYPNASFDAVIANHMLYHVRDRGRAIAEVQRILKPGGVFHAATNGRAHLREINDLLERFRIAVGIQEELTTFDDHNFTLENGYEQLAPCFSHVTVRRYQDALIVTEVEPLVAYILSYAARAIRVPEQRAALTRFIAHEMARTGAIRITKDSGLFLAWNA